MSPTRIAGPCPVTGCPNRAGQCETHRKQREQLRGTRQARGYDAAHDALGRDYQRRMDAGERFDCWRCGKKLGTRRNVDWQLGHDDTDRTKHNGPECPRCNQATSGRRNSPRA